MTFIVPLCVPIVAVIVGATRVTVNKQYGAQVADASSYRRPTELRDQKPITEFETIKPYSPDILIYRCVVVKYPVSQVISRIAVRNLRWLTMKSMLAIVRLIDAFGVTDLNFPWLHPCVNERY